MAGRSVEAEREGEVVPQCARRTMSDPEEVRGRIANRHNGLSSVGITRLNDRKGERPERWMRGDEPPRGVRKRKKRSLRRKGDA